MRTWIWIGGGIIATVLVLFAFNTFDVFPGQETEHQNNITLPPDPGSEGLLTVEGIDVDQDGVRDDVQRYLAVRYPDSKLTQAALTQFAVAMQHAINSAENVAASRTAANALDRAVECLRYAHPNDGSDMREELFAEIVNTKLRLAAYDQFEQNIDGTVFQLSHPNERVNSCEFDPNTLSN